MSACLVRTRLGALAGVLLVTLAASAGVAGADERTETAVPPSPLAPAVLSMSLSAETPLPAGAIPWTTLLAPPAHGEAGGMVQGGGGGPRFRYYALDALGSVRACAP